MQKTISKYMAKIGRKGAVNGWEKLSPEERKEKISKLTASRAKKNTDEM